MIQTWPGVEAIAILQQMKSQLRMWFSPFGSDMSVLEAEAGLLWREQHAYFPYSDVVASDSESLIDTAEGRIHLNA